MLDDKLARHLHDKATRGGTLTEAEQACLEAWYAQQDKEENDRLMATAPDSLTTLRGQVDAALAHLVTVTQRIQTLADENEALRRDIAALHQQLADSSSTRAA